MTSRDPVRRSRRSAIWRVVPTTWPPSERKRKKCLTLRSRSGRKRGSFNTFAVEDASVRPACLIIPPYKALYRGRFYHAEFGFLELFLTLIWETKIHWYSCMSVRCKTSMARPYYCSVKNIQLLYRRSETFLRQSS